MAERANRVAAVCRRRAAVLVRTAEGGGRCLPTAPVDDASAEEVLASLLDRLGLEGATAERRGDPVAVGDGRVVPFLVAVDGRSDDGTATGPRTAWAPPAVLLGERDDRWWRVYRAVAPSAETLAADAERGSAVIAVDALWALRDAATEAGAAGSGLGAVDDAARRLIAAHPSMAALSNRVNRAMAGASSPADVVEAAAEGIARAEDADAAAARLAAGTVDGAHVLTLSRSGTVRLALLAADATVEVLRSLPGGEGRAVASELRESGLAAETVADAAVYDRLRSGAVDVVLVGADGVTPDGGVVNKVGTRAAAHAAEVAGVACYAVGTADKVRPTDGDLDTDPWFDWTPPRLVTAVLTERGRLDPDAVNEVAREHRALADWQDHR